MGRNPSILGVLGLLVAGCGTDDWCRRFNLDCVAPVPFEVPEGIVEISAVELLGTPVTLESRYIPAGGSGGIRPSPCGRGSRGLRGAPDQQQKNGAAPTPAQ